MSITAEDIKRVDKLNGNDIVFAFMGPTGSGKSNFIDSLTGEHNTRSGHRLQSCTDKVRATRVRNHPQQGDRIVLVDTPGFDDTNKSDMEILQMIGDWLEKTYKKHIKLTGIVYLHRITDNRMAGSPHKNLRMFGELCGDAAAKRVVLVTTMWDKVRRDVGIQRQKELEHTYWKPMLDLGTHTDRFHNTQESAWAVIDNFLQKDNESERLLLQEELVDLNKRLNETQAGVTLYSSLQKLLAEQKETVRLLVEQAKSQENPKLAEELAKEHKRIEHEFQKTFEDVKKLKIPIGRRIQMFFFSKKAHSRSIKLG